MHVERMHCTETDCNSGWECVIVAHDSYDDVPQAPTIDSLHCPTCGMIGEPENAERLSEALEAAY